MNPFKVVRLVTVGVLVLGSAAPLAAGLAATSSVDPRIRLDWEVGARRGRPVIQGYVYDDYFLAAYNVQLLVETLDASGAVIGRNIGFVRGVVPINDRTYFEVPLKTPGALYRVSVTGLAWLSGGGAGGGGM